jgi:hypothetical protein
MGTSSNRVDADNRLAAAIEEIRIERRRTADELEALQSFEDEVRSIPSEETGFDDGLPVAVATATAEPTTGLRRVQEAYESTLMSVPHYLEEYDDTYIESLASEFSPEIASALTDATGFNDRCKQSVLSAVSNAQSARESLIDVVDRERESVREAKAEIDPLLEECRELGSVQFNQEDFGTLDAYRSRLQVIATKCRNRSDQRQDAIFDQRRIQKLPTDVPDVTVYFYQNLDIDYPVMSLIAEVMVAVTECRRRIERAMTYCHA